MPRTSRLIISDEKAVYHVMSRTALDGFPLKDVEKDFMIDLIKRYSGLYFVEILGVCIMGNHFHLLVKTLPEYKFTDQDIKKCYVTFMVRTVYSQMGSSHPYGRNYQAFLNLFVK